MELIAFKGQNIVYAKDQPQYRPMPAHRVGDEKDTVICCWELTEEEIKQVVETGKIWHSIMTFGGPLQPQHLSVENPFADLTTVEKEDD
jgi:hypothetical protein